MRGYRIAPSMICTIALAGLLQAQTPGKADFGRDVLPILRQNCIGCHGPAQQISGLRLDRRSAALNRKGVVPGSSDNSFLFHRISGKGYGMQMPPTGPLRAEQIEVIKTWIDQGAEWPDSLANEAELPPLNPKAVAVVEVARAGSAGPGRHADQITRLWFTSAAPGPRGALCRCGRRPGARAPARPGCSA